MKKLPPLSEEDKELFRQAVEQMKPIELPEAPPSFTPAPEPLYLNDTTLFHLSSETPMFYSQSALSKSTLQPFKRGQCLLEGQLDLHGMTIQEAKEALISFVFHHHQLRHRTLLIVHGKGKHTGEPILKNLLNHWLPQFPQVLAFTSAMPKDGGAGAVYLLLKR